MICFNSLQARKVISNLKIENVSLSLLPRYGRRLDTRHSICIADANVIRTNLEKRPVLTVKLTSFSENPGEFVCENAGYL